jgi:hypothetical protein
MAYAKKYGHDIWYVECKKFLYGRFTNDSLERIFFLFIAFLQSTQDT